MKVLLVYPKVMETFWSFVHALKIVRKKSAFPPLGLLTVASMLPDSWEKRLVDINVEPLTDEHLRWAECVFISAMVAQRQSTEEVIRRCKSHRVKTVGGGPLFMCYGHEFPDVDHLVLGEAEAIFPEFLIDLEKGEARREYYSKEHPDLSNTPPPSWHLIKLSNYATMSIQYSRGCPYDCEFCDIIVMNGRRPRTKGLSQFISELEALYNAGWRGSVFIVDDNFIGNRRHVKELLPEVIRWQRERNYPFTFFTEASVDLASDIDLMKLMVEAGFDKVFLGIETPEEESLKECGKHQNLRQNLSHSVRTILSNGLAVMGGFIIGFDHDKPDIFEKQYRFIQENGIVTAMVGLLSVIPTTRLYKRLEREGRLLSNFKPSGDNTHADGALNFIPKLDREWLIENYRKLMAKLYEPKTYYDRIKRFLEFYRPRMTKKPKLEEFEAFLRSLWFLGIKDRAQARLHYWKSLWNTLLNHRSALVEAITYAVYGYHFRKMFWETGGKRQIAVE
ncbi:MAG: DUF4070 domain-containing protein [Syntrophobacterales bacterium]|nr:DUF4070 domain-containing protein [Syntrophobacterales bacterium]